MDTEPCGYGIPPDILQEVDMKCIAIQVDDITGEEMTLEKFVESSEAKSPLGKLLIALTQETAWSNDYTVVAHINEVSRQQPRLVISHKAFIRPLTIKDVVGTDLSLRGAENAVRAHFNECRKWMRPTIEYLNGQINDMRQASEDIAVDKARAAIVAAFSEAVDISQTPITAGRDLYAFHKKDIDHGPIYVARKLDHEFVGGVARIDCSASRWYGLRDGIEKGQRHGLFWAELARAFAARELGVPEKDLLCDSVSASEKPRTFLEVEPYIVRQAVLRILGEKENAVVQFRGNLPAWAHRELP